MTISEVVADIILAAIIIITYWFQRKKIGALETSINTHKDVISAQKEIIDAMKKAHEIIDPDKYKKYIEFLERINEEQIQQARITVEEEMGEKLENLQEKCRDLLNLALNHYADWVKLASSALLYVHPDDRVTLIENLKIDKIEAHMVKYLPEIKDKWIYPSPYTGFIAMSEVITKNKSGSNATKNPR